MTCSPLAISDVGNVIVCTSSTRPTGTQRYVGRFIYETDTGRMYVWKGSAWGFLSGSPPRWNVHPLAGQNVANSTNTGLVWGGENYDTDGFHSTALNTDRVTIPAGLGGVYMVGYTVGVNAASNVVAAWIDVNGVGAGIRYAFNQIPNNSSFGVLMQGAAPIVLNAGDYINVTVFQNSGSTLNMNVNNTSYQFWGYLVSAT